MDSRFAAPQNDLILRTARGEKVERPPIWVMRQAGRYLPQYHERKGTKDFFECCRDPEVASDLTLQPIDEYDGLIDAAIIFSDILVVPQAMGMEVVMLDKKGPHFPDPLKSPDDQQYKDIMAREVDVNESLDYVYKAITMTRTKLKGRVPLIGFCGAPWTLLCYMVEGGGTKLFKEIKLWIYQYPEESKKLLQKIAEVCVRYLAQQVKAGAQVSTTDNLRHDLQLMLTMADDTGLRFLGRRVISRLFQGLRPAIPPIHCRKPPQAFGKTQPPQSPDDSLRQGRLVRSRRSVQIEL